MKTTVTMDAGGSLVIPPDVRQAIHVEGETLFEVEAMDDVLILRPAEAIRDEDRWAYTPEHLARVERARREGRGRIMTERELLDLLDE